MNIYNYTYNRFNENYFNHNHSILNRFLDIFNRKIGCTGIPTIRKRNESSIPNGWKYLDNYFIQQGSKAGKFAVEGFLWGGRKCFELASGTIIELFFAKRRMEFLKKSFDFFYPYFLGTRGGKIRTACLLALVICNVFQSYLLFFTNNINKKFYALSGQETITSEDFQEAFTHFVYWTGLQFGLTFFQTITQEWLKIPS